MKISTENSEAIPYVTNESARSINAAVQTDPIDEKTHYRAKISNFSVKHVIKGGGHLLKNKILDTILLLSGIITGHQEFMAGLKFNFPTTPMMLLGNLVGLIRVGFVVMF
jgi:hypothetical protein